MKYCDECKHFRKSFLRPKDLGRCIHEGAKIEDQALISRSYAPFAEHERRWGNCGTDAKLHEPLTAPKEPSCK